MKKNSAFIIFGVLIFIIIGAAIYSLKFYDKYERNNVQNKENNKIHKIGIVYAGGVYEQAVLGMENKLKEEGYIEGANIIYITKNVEGNMDTVNNAVTEIMQQKPDLIYTVSTPVTTKVWKEAGKDLPIVFNIVGDPVGAGFAKDYKSSGTNLTGCSNSSAELSGKRLETFVDAFPNIKKVVTIYDPNNAFSALSINNTRNAAQILGIILAEFQIKSVDDMDKVLGDIKTGEYDGFYITPDATVVSQIDKIIKKSQELKIPTMGHESSLVDKGITMSYGANFYQMGYQCAYIVMAVLRGKEPSSIPVQTPRKLEIIINEKNSRELGLFPSPEVLGRADKVLK
jgi:putative tryptophan/tyrosine transport system substrate-binding protein